MFEMKAVRFFVLLFIILTGALQSSMSQAATSKPNMKRIYALIESLPQSTLKTELLKCQAQPLTPHPFSIGHRGAPLFLPEHTKQSYQAGFEMGAATLECDVTFTKDQQLVCRHSQCDLHSTTNILQTELANTCRVPFSGATDKQPATAQCCTSEITLDEFLSLKGRMDKVNPRAKRVEDYLPDSPEGQLMSHQQSIKLFRQLGTKMSPELKEAMLKPESFSQHDYARQMIEDYKTAGVAMSAIWPQSFHLDDIVFWLQNYPELRKQIVYLDGRYEDDEFNPNDLSSLSPSMAELKELGLTYIAPPIWVLLTLEQTPQGIKIVPSEYAKQAKAAGLSIITWSLERSGPLSKGGGWYYQSITPILKHDGQVFEVLEVLAKQVGVTAVFSDWPATTSYYANCMLD